MVRVLVAGIIALIMSIVIGPSFIRYLRKKEYGQQIREVMPSRHLEKQGTPTMGGVLILIAMAIPFLALTGYTTNALLVFLVTLSCGAIGFTDDFIKLTHKRSLGLQGRWKLALLGLITVAVAYVTHHRHFETKVYIPVVNGKIPLSWGWYVLLFFIIAGAANGVNLTDGLDGLAAGTGIIAVFTFTSMAVIAWIRSGAPGHRDQKYLDLAILGAALIGAIVGFLWYNAWPAEVFMGDTGSMAIGGALAAFAIVLKVEFLLLLIGGIFLIEALSVMIQVFSYRRWGRRVFLMAPIHYHFEMKAWSETKIMVRFWILCAILCALGFALYYRYYFQFFRGK
jgi:phospho-N-acetylmuramoyl-pentapeptide-transferase